MLVLVLVVAGCCSSEVAMIYNDKAVLENFHASAVFRIMKDDENYNILANLKKDEYRSVDTE